HFPLRSKYPRPFAPRAGPSPPANGRLPTRRRTPIPGGPAHRNYSPESAVRFARAARKKRASSGNRKHPLSWPLRLRERCRMQSGRSRLFRAPPGGLPASRRGRLHRPCAYRLQPDRTARAGTWLELPPLRWPSLPAIRCGENWRPARCTSPLRRLPRARGSFSSSGHGQKNRERGSKLSLAFHANAAAMLFDHFLADGKTQTGASRLRGESRLEDLFELRSFHPVSLVLEVDLHAVRAVRRPQNPDIQSPAVLHCLKRVESQIEEHLLQSVGVRGHHHSSDRIADFDFEAALPRERAEKIGCFTQ